MVVSFSTQTLLARLPYCNKRCSNIASSVLFHSTSTSPPQHKTKIMPSPLNFFMNDLLLNVHGVTAATIVVDNARSSQKTTILPASMSSSTSSHSCSRWEWCIEPPISILASSTHSSSSTTKSLLSSSDDRAGSPPNLPPLQPRRAPLAFSNHSVPACPQRQLSRDINDESNKEQQDPHRPSIATILKYAPAPTTPTFDPRMQIKISHAPPRDTIDAIGEDVMLDRPIRRLSKTLGRRPKTLSLPTFTSQAPPTCPVRRQSPAPRYASFRPPMMIMDEEHDSSSMDGSIAPPTMPPFLTSRTNSMTSVSSTESDCCTADNLRGPRRRPGGRLLPPCPPVCTTPSSSESAHHKRVTRSSSSSRSANKRFHWLARTSSR
jgi:hypothetical protein